MSGFGSKAVDFEFSHSLGHKRTLHGGDRHSKDETEEVVVQGLAQFLGGPHNKRSPLHN